MYSYGLFFFFCLVLFFSLLFYDDDLISEKTLIWEAVGVNTIRRVENLSGSKSFVSLSQFFPLYLLFL